MVSFEKRLAILASLSCACESRGKNSRDLSDIASSIFNLDLVTKNC